MAKGCSTFQVGAQWIFYFFALNLLRFLIQVILLCQPIYNKNITVVPPADIDKCKQESFFCQTGSLPATLEQCLFPAVQQTPGPSRAEHHLWEHHALSLQTHKFECFQLWCPSWFQLLVSRTRQRDNLPEMFWDWMYWRRDWLFYFFLISLRNEMKCASVRERLNLILSKRFGKTIVLVGLHFVLLFSKGSG